MKDDYKRPAVDKPDELPPPPPPAKLRKCSNIARLLRHPGETPAIDTTTGARFTVAELGRMIVDSDPVEAEQFLERFELAE